MIQEDWKRLCSVRAMDEGTMAAIWLAVDRRTDTVHLYDACMFEREVLAVIAEGLNARGRWIPIIWRKKDKAFAKQLEDRGCNVIPEGADESDSIAEVAAREVEERMRSGRFKVDKRLQNWLDQYKTFYRQDQKIPLASHPLMAATLTGVIMFDEWARPQRLPGTGRANYPDVAVV